MYIVDDEDTRQIRGKLDFPGCANFQRDAFTVQAGSVELLTETVDLDLVRVDCDYVKLGLRDKRLQQSVLSNPQHKCVTIAIANCIEDLFAETRQAAGFLGKFFGLQWITCNGLWFSRSKAVEFSIRSHNEQLAIGDEHRVNLAFDPRKTIAEMERLLSCMNCRLYIWLSRALINFVLVEITVNVGVHHNFAPSHVCRGEPASGQASGPGQDK
ncbi:MAG: hypothetical protein RQ760_18960 [Sedimentisphaerales bacterium]|nr:hypothetical protein [Sedimentisphaerales bacterium]